MPHVVHLNSHDVGGGAEKVASRLVAALPSFGWSSTFLVGNKTVPNSSAFAFALKADQRQGDAFRAKGLLFHEQLGSFDLPRNPLILAADVVHIHNLHGCYFHPRALAGLSQTRPTLWTLHDMQGMTGHCAYSVECTRWQTGCGLCPDLTLEPRLEVDSSAELWTEKRDTYDASRLWIVAPSEWMRGIAQKSILRKHSIHCIPNGVPTKVFCPIPKLEARALLGLPQEALLTGGVAQFGALGNRWKGAPFLRKAIDAITAQEPRARFVNIGAVSPSGHPAVIDLPYIENETRLAAYYSALDLLLHTSIAETFGLVVAEAMSCGVPIVAFATGGIPEIIEEGVHGRLVPTGDVDALVYHALQLLRDPASAARYGAATRDHIVRHFDHDLMTQRYVRLYEEMQSVWRGEERNAWSCESGELTNGSMRTTRFDAVDKKNPHSNPTGTLPKESIAITKPLLDESVWIDALFELSAEISRVKLEAARVLAERMEVIRLGELANQERLSLIELLTRRLDILKLLRKHFWVKLGFLLQFLPKAWRQDSS